MQFKTQDEVRREIYERRMKEEQVFEIARKMLARKMPVSDIIDLTGLGREDVLSLQ